MRGVWSGRARQVYAGGTVRIDTVRRDGARRRAERTFLFGNGSRAEQVGFPGRFVISFYDRDGYLRQTRTSIVGRNADGAIVAETTVTDGDGD